jgi:hypothetical protein
VLAGRSAPRRGDRAALAAHDVNVHRTARFFTAAAVWIAANVD